MNEPWPNITLEPTDFIGKHFAKPKSKMLTYEICGSAWRWAQDNGPAGA